MNKTFAHVPLTDAERAELQKKFDRKDKENLAAFAGLCMVLFLWFITSGHFSHAVREIMGGTALAGTILFFIITVFREPVIDGRTVSDIQPLDVERLESLATIADSCPPIKEAIAQWFNAGLTITRADLQACEQFARELQRQQRRDNVVSKLQGRAAMLLTMPSLVIAHGPTVPDAPWLSSPAGYAVAAIACSLIAARCFKRGSRAGTVFFVICAMSALLGIVVSSKA